jgi:O-antigen/teichoic acid export membrane protein
MGKVTFITTVRNDEKGVVMLLASLLKQMQLPDEVIVVDAESNDGTMGVLENFKTDFEKKHVPFKIISARCNRAQGRNIAIQQAKNGIIAVSDAGCLLAKDWLLLMTKPFNDKDIDLVSGYYTTGKGNVFQRCMAAYTSVMPDKLTDEYLPSSRSIAFRKSAWKKVNGYPEYLDTCEDLMFARNVKNAGATFYLEKKALVIWPQVTTILAAAKQFFGYAHGDGQAHYMRRQTPFLFGRYILAIILWKYLLVALLLYLFWAIAKNYRYVRNPQAIILLPLLQIVSDFAVMSGMILGYLDRAPIAKATLWQVLGKIASALIGVATFSLLARALQPVDMSAYTYVTSFVVLLLTFADGGVDTVVTREAHKKNNDVAYLLGVRCLLCAIIVGVSFFIGGIFIIAAIGQSFLLLINAMVSFYKGKKDFQKAALLNISLATSTFLGVLVALFFKPGVATIILSTSFVTLLVFLWLKPRFSIRILPIKKIFSIAFSLLPLGLASMMSVAYLKLDVIFLGYFFSPHIFPDVGLYAMAYRPFEVMIVLGGLYTQTLLPYMVDNVNNRAFIIATFFKTILIATFLGALTFFSAGFIVQILGGSDYSASVQALRILSLGVFATVIAGYAYTIVIAHKKEHFVLLSSIIALCINVVMNFLLIPQQSFIGASWATVATQAALCLTALYAAFISLKGWHRLT